MDNKEQLTKKFIMVDMDEIGVSTDEKYIIGTQALSPCIGFLLHSPEKEKAIVGHISCGQLLENNKVNNLRFQISTLLEQEQLQNAPLNLKIIEGAYRSDYSVSSHELDILDIFGKSKYSLVEVLEEVIKKSCPSNIDAIEIYDKETISSSIQIVDEFGNLKYGDDATLSRRFAFDSKSGKFVTDKVYFGPEYFEINKSNIK